MVRKELSVVRYQWSILTTDNGQLTTTLCTTHYPQQCIPQIVRQPVFRCCVQPECALGAAIELANAKQRRAQPLELLEEVARIGQATPCEECVVLLFGQPAQLEQRGRAIETIHAIVLVAQHQQVEHPRRQLPNLLANSVGQLAEFLLRGALLLGREANVLDLDIERQVGAKRHMKLGAALLAPA